MSSPQTAQPNLGPTLGALLIGVVLGAAFLGITGLQTAFYYRTYHKDSTRMKVLVGVLCMLDVLSLALWNHAAYTYLVTNYGNLAVANTLVWSVAGEPPITGLIALSVHLFLSWRIQILDRRWRILSIAIAVVSFASFSMVLTAVTLEAAGLKHGLSNSAVIKQVEWYMLAGDLSASVIDLTIAGSISYLLYRGRSGFSNTNRILTKIMLYTVASGTITSIIRLIYLILSRAYPNTLYFLIPYISSSKAYTNAFLATLNSRSRRSDTPATDAIELRNGTMDLVNVAFERARSGSDELAKVA